jgi:hypothetical protein
LRAGFSRGRAGLLLDDAGWSFSLLRETYQLRRTTELYAELVVQSEPLLAYGASGRATVWFNQLPELDFAAVVDDSPARVGKYVPGVGLPIISWDERLPTETCVITAWNYAEEIQQRRKYEGRWTQTWR